MSEPNGTGKLILYLAVHGQRICLNGLSQKGILLSIGVDAVVKVAVYLK